MATTDDLHPLLSLVVATLGRRREIVALLQSIAAHDLRQIEVIIVDQNDQQLDEELAASRAPVVAHLRSNVRNASAARNLGAAAAKTGWLMFPDDDATFQPDALDRLLALIREDRHDLISGQIVDDSGTPHLLQWLPDASAITPDTLDQTLVESAFAIRRDLFNSVNGFDPLFGPGGRFHSGEGADLVRRLWRAGSLRAWFTPEIALQHPAKLADPTVDTAGRIYCFAMGEAALTLRHRKQLRMAPICRKLLLRLAGTFISSGDKRRRKIAFLKGFLAGVTEYRKLQRSQVAPGTAARQSEPGTIHAGQ